LIHFYKRIRMARCHCRLRRFYAFMRLVPVVLLALCPVISLACHGFIRDIYEAKIKREWDAIWRETGTVPNELSKVPDKPMKVRFGDIEVTPNKRMEQSQMREAPSVSWDADPSALYTLILEDQDVNLPQGTFKYAHWMVSNIQGSDVASGNINIPYVPSGPFEMNATWNGVDMSTDYTHRYLFLAYKQKERIQASEHPEGCSSVVLFDHDDLQAKYNLEGPVAGNFYRCGFSLEYFTQTACYLTQCMGAPFPIPLPGINDKPECTEQEG